MPTADFYEALLENISEMVWILDHEGTILFESPSCSRTLGYDPGWLTGHNAINFLHPDDHNLAQKILDEVAGNENPHHPTELRFRHKDGSWIYLEALGQNMQNSPAVCGLIFTTRNITDRKFAEEQLQHSEERYQRMVNLTPDGIVSLTTAGVITSCNKTFLDLSGCTMEDIIGKHFTKIPSLIRQNLSEYAEILRNILNGITQRNYEFRWLHADGSKRWGQADVTLMYSEKGEKQIQAVLRDITEQKRTEILLNALKEASNAIIGITTPQEIYRTLARIFDQIDISSIILLYDEDTQHLRPAYLSQPPGLIQAAQKLAGLSMESYTFPIKGIAPFEETVIKRGAVYIEEASSIAKYALPQVSSQITQLILQGMDYHQVIAAPIITRNQVIGILCVSSKNLLERDCATIKVFAQQLSAALETSTHLERALEEIRQRTQAEKALQESEARLQSLINTIPEPTYLIDLENRVLAANSFFLEQSRRKTADILNYQIEELLTDDFIQSHQAAIRNVKETGTGITFEDTHGGSFYLNHIHPVYDTEQNLSRIAVFTIDITDQKQKEEHIQHLLERQITINEISISLSAEQSPDGIYTVIGDQVAKSITPYSFQIALYNPEEHSMNFKHVFRNGSGIPSDEFSPLSLETHEDIVLSRILKPEKPLLFTRDDSACAGKFDTVLSLIMSGLPGRDESTNDFTGVQSLLVIPMILGDNTIGAFYVCSKENDHFHSSVIDFLSALAGMTAIAVRNTQLLAYTRRQAQQMEQIIRSVPEGVALLSADFKVITSNPSTDSYLNILAPQWNTHPLNMLGNHAIENIVRQTPENIWQEIQIEDEDRIRYFETQARPLASGSMENGWVLVMREVTQEREIQQRIQQQERLASVGQLAAGIAHDFNNILVPIVLYAEIVKDEPDLPPVISERMEIILNQALRAASLTQQILDFSRRSMIQPMALDLVPFIKEMKHLLERTLPENIHINVKTTGVVPTIHADITRMQQVFLNLALNARDAMPDGGTITFSLDSIVIPENGSPPFPEIPSGQWLRFRCHDTGSGISKKDLPHIFEPFFTTKSPDKGSGLGLAQVYGIVKQHSGFIHVESSPGESTEFIIYLPLKAGCNEDISQMQETPAVAGSGETILIVEDDAAVLKAISEVVGRLGYRCMEAQSSLQAVELYRQACKEIALVLSDMVMPDMSGFELLEELKTINPEVRIIAMSGYPLGEDLQDADNSNFAGWIHKPINVRSVSEVISSSLSDESTEG